MFNAIAIILHLIAINVWVGGMFFLILVLGRAIATLEQPQQLVLWAKVLRYFFFWVWLSVLTLLTTGTGMIIYRFNGFVNAPIYVLAMFFLGILMISVFLLMYFIFYRKFMQSFKNQAVDAAREQLRVLRRLGIINMVLGLCVVVVIGGGPFIPI